MKRIMVFAITCMVIILTTGSIPPASAGGLQPRGGLPWRIEPIVNNTDVRSIAAGYDVQNRAALIASYDTISQKFRQATSVGIDQGNCGANGDWNCTDVFNGVDNRGFYNDVAFYQNLVGESNYTETGYAWFGETDNSLNFLYTYKIDEYNSGGGWTKLLSFGDYPMGQIGSQPSLIYDANADPHIAVIVDGSPYDYLIYIHHVESGGTCEAVGGDEFWDCDAILTGSNIADDPSIGITAGGFPTIAYYNPGVGSLAYAYPFSDPSKANCGTSNNWRCITIDGSLNNGKYPSLAIDEETFIGYYNFSTGALMIAQYVGGGGNCGNDWNGYTYANRWQCDQIDQVGAGVTKMGLSLVVDGKKPVLAYMDSTGYQTTVRLAQPTSRLGLDVGNCGPVDLYYTWYCETLAQGQYGFGREIDMAVNSAGALHIAYLEENDYAGQNQLWSARQYFPGYLPLLKK